MNKNSDCVVSLIDLDNTMKKQSPSKVMRKLHGTPESEIFATLSLRPATGSSMPRSLAMEA